jgi:hypothetical protein
MTMYVSAKTVGQRKAHFTDWEVPIPPQGNKNGGQITLRDLIAGIVANEVEAFVQRQEARRLPQVMTKAAIDAAAVRGKIATGTQVENEQVVNLEEAIGTALLAFEDGWYYVFIDETQYHSLDSEVFVKPQSRVLFLRLVPLAGG